MPLRGAIAIAPNGVSLPCEGDGEVSISNPGPAGGEALTMLSIEPSNSYRQGDYGTGFTCNLSGIALPITLARGEQVAFAVHHSAAGQTRQRTSSCARLTPAGARGMARASPAVDGRRVPAGSETR